MTLHAFPAVYLHVPHRTFCNSLLVLSQMALHPWLTPTSQLLLQPEPLVVLHGCRNTPLTSYRKSTTLHSSVHCLLSSALQLCVFSRITTLENTHLKSYRVSTKPKERYGNFHPFSNLLVLVILSHIFFPLISCLFFTLSALDQHVLPVCICALPLLSSRETLQVCDNVDQQI